MDFKTATNVLISAPSMTLGRIAAIFGREMHTIARARMDGANSRRPPADWEYVLARVARDYARTLRAYAKQLDQLSRKLERR